MASGDRKGKMAKICYLIGTLDIGGAEKQLLKLCHGLDKSRFQPVVIPFRRGGPLKKYFEESGIKVIEAGKRYKIDWWFFFHLVGILRREKPDIVQTFMFTANTWGRLAAVLTRTPVIFSSERCVDLWKRWYHRVIDRFLLRFTRKMVANSQSVKDFYVRLEQIPPDKIEVIPNGLEIEEFDKITGSNRKRKELGLKETDLVIASGGRFTSQKGLEYLVKAAPEVVKAFPEAHFVLVGNGPLREKLECMAVDLSVANSLIFTGYRNDIYEIFAGADIVAVPSLFEGMPNIVMEAMALKKPVVASDIPEIAELIINGENGFLVPVRNADDLAKKIVVLLRDSQLSHRMGEAGYRLIREQFPAVKMVKRYERLYSSE